MRNANSQCPRSMILVRAMHQLSAPHVSHAEIAMQTIPIRMASAAPC